MFRRVLAVVIMIVLLSTLVIGCSSKAPEKTDATTQAETTQATTQAVTEAKVIELTNWDDLWSDDPAWGGFMKDLYDSFMKEFPNIKVTRINGSKGGPKGESMNLVAALAAGTGPATMEWIDVQTFAAKGYIAPLDEYFANWPEAKDLEPAIMNFCKYQGKTYALPTMWHYFTPKTIFYRKDLAQKAGLDVNNEPKTWADFEAWAKKFADSGYKSGIILNTATAKNWVIANGGTKVTDLVDVNPDGTMTSNLNSPENIKLFTWLQGLAKQKLLDTTMLLDDQTALDKYMTGKIGMFTNNFGQVHRAFIPGGMTNEQIGFFQYPGETGTKAVVVDGGRAAINGNLSKEKQAAAFELLRYLRANKEVLKTKVWPFQKKVDYRPVMLTTFVDMQTDLFNILGLDPTYSDKMKSLIINPLSPVDVGYGDSSAYIEGAFQAIIIKQADVKTELDKASEAITKELLEPTNKTIIESKFYKELKDNR